MTPLETLLLNSLSTFSAESTRREQRLIEQLNAVSERLESMTQRYHALQQQVDALAQRLDRLSEALSG